MSDEAAATAPRARLPLSVPFYYGWFIVALSFCANLTMAGIRSAPSVLIHPLEAEFGWTRTEIASAASLNLLLLGLFGFAILYGLDWYASGPATTTIIARVYGPERVGRIFGLAFMFHQLGGAGAAIAGGWVRMQFGDYQYAFVIGGCMGLVAAILALTVRNTECPRPGVAPNTELARA